MKRERLKMRLALPRQRVKRCAECRIASASDLSALSKLLLDAYRGTIDDEEQTLEEAFEELQGLFAGKYGPFLEDCSFLIQRDRQVLSCTLVTLWHDAPLLAFVMTEPAAKNQGLGALLVKRSMAALRAHGYSDLSLVVTRGNLPAQHLYEKLGFQVVETFVG